MCWSAAGLETWEPSELRQSSWLDWIGLSQRTSGRKSGTVLTLKTNNITRSYIQGEKELQVIHGQGRENHTRVWSHSREENTDRSRKIYIKENMTTSQEKTRDENLPEIAGATLTSVVQRSSSQKHWAVTSSSGSSDKIMSSRWVLFSGAQAWGWNPQQVQPLQRRVRERERREKQQQQQCDLRGERQGDTGKHDSFCQTLD